MRYPQRSTTAMPAVLLLVALLAACQGGTAAPRSESSAASASASALTDPSASPSQRVVSGKVDVGGHSLYYACFGEGSPTVILEHGLGGDLGQWGAVIPAISPRTTVCGYDRANVRGSNTVDGLRTAADSVADLHALLRRAPIAGPYVLVGFSWGGLVDQLYARTYPDEVKGLVLVDSNSADEDRTYWAHLTPAQVAADKQEIAGPNPEHVDIVRSFDLVHAAPAMPDIPLVVVSHTVADPNAWPPGWDPATFEKLGAQLQAGLVHLTSKGSQVFAEGAGHDIPEEAPDVVSKAILRVLDAVGRS
jgi:pimeloyl-ACP methyl ester carboxylesterase